MTPSVSARLWPFALLLVLLAATTVRADIVLVPDHITLLPANRMDVIGLGFLPAGQAVGDDQSHLVMMTDTDTWASNANGSAPFNVIFNPTIAGVSLNQDSRVAYDPVSQRYTFTGGTFDARFYVYSAGTGTVLNHNTVNGWGETMLGLADSPSGLAVRNGTNDIFVSFGGSSPSLYRHIAGAGNQTGVLFGNTGPGAVSSGVGAMVIGPDGRLNVLDTGLQKILRYDPVTLAYLDSFSLVNTITDNAAMVVSSTGYIFTANTAGTSGVIYDYLTGDYAGTFTGPSGDPNGLGDRVVMADDDDGNVYVTNPTVTRQVAVFSTSAIPEPSTFALLAAASLGFILLRRRQQGASETR